MSFMKAAVRGLAVATLLAGTSSMALAQEVTLKLHQFLPAQASVPRLILDVWADKVEADSDGRIKIDRYPSMQLGGRPPELVDQMMDGVADIIWTVTGYTPGRFPRPEAFEMPFTMTNGEDPSRAYWQYVEKKLLDQDAQELKQLAGRMKGPRTKHSKEQNL